jgi:hypothetical protein
VPGNVQNSPTVNFQDYIQNPDAGLWTGIFIFHLSHGHENQLLNKSEITQPSDAANF